MSNFYKKRFKSMSHALVVIGAKKNQNWYSGVTTKCQLILCHVKHATTYCSPPDFLENSIPAIPEMLQNAETLVEPARLNADSIESQYQSQWQLPCPANCPVNSELSNEKEEMTIDEGTITVSSVYSQNIFTALTDAMENLGIDLSQASVTVHVNLGRRAMFRRPNIMSSAKEQKGMPAI